MAKWIRIILSVSWIILPWLVLVISNLPHAIESAEGQCAMMRCRGAGRQDPLLSVVLLFPPGYAGLLILSLRDRRHLSWWSYFMLSVLGLIGLQALAMIWMMPTSITLDMIIRDMWALPTRFMVLGVGMGWAVLWYAAHTCLLYLPRPLGRSGEDWWFTNRGPYSRPVDKDKTSPSAS